MPYIKSLIIVLVLLTGGCFRENYPSSWARVSQVHLGCPNLSGSYKDRSEIAPHTKGRHLSLSKIFLSLDEELTTKVSRVEILHQENGVITFTAWNNDQILRGKLYSINNGDFKCDSGFLSMNWSPDAFAAGGGFGVGALTYEIMRSSDGALILKEKGFTIGFYGILPLAAGGDSWHRFPRQNNSNPTSRDDDQTPTP